VPREILRSVVEGAYYVEATGDCRVLERTNCAANIGCVAKAVEQPVGHDDVE
jgi:hypothetical protein